MRNIYHWICGLFKRKRGLKPEEIAKRLSPQVRAAVAAEAQFLRGQHQVEVRALEADEKPGKPRAADPAVEQLLTEQE